MRVEVNISKEVLDWVMAHIHPDELPINTVTTLQQWRSGEKTPTFNQIEQISKAVSMPLGYFFLSTPPAEDISFTEYRTVDSMLLNNPSRNLIDTVNDMELTQEWVRDHILSIGGTPNTFVGAIKATDSVTPSADFVRKTLGIDTAWYQNVKDADGSFKFLRNAISQSGVIVMANGIVGANTHRPLKINEFRAFALVDKYAPLIFINSRDSSGGEVFSLLHEFVHICIGENSLFNDRHGTGTSQRKTEAICNAVAVEVLAPNDTFIQVWRKYADRSDLDDAIFSVAKSFRCSNVVIARRAYDNNFISKEEYTRISKAAAKNYDDAQEKKGSGGDYYRTALSRFDNRFLKMLIESVSEGKTLYTDAFRLTKTNRSTFSALAEEIGGRAK